MDVAISLMCAIIVAPNRPKVYTFCGERFQHLHLAACRCAVSILGSFMTKTGTGREHVPMATSAIRGPLLTYTGDPFQLGLERSLVYEPDAIVAMDDGRITHSGPAENIRRLLPACGPVKDYGRDALIISGFIDCHAQFPQTPIIGPGGEQLIDWPKKYTLVPAQKF